MRSGGAPSVIERRGVGAAALGMVEGWPLTALGAAGNGGEFGLRLGVAHLTHSHGCGRLGMWRGGKSRKARVLVEGGGMGFSTLFLVPGRIGPFTNL